MKHTKYINLNDRDEGGMTSLMFALREGHVNIVEHLLGMEDIDVNIQDEDGWTALMFASREGHLDVAKCLIEAPLARIEGVHGALTELRNNKGETAKMLAETDEIRALFE